MNKRLFWILFGGILALAFLLRIVLVFDNNFYFTVDQGNDAVHVREILERHTLLTHGPETGIQGIYAGPLWYYFIGIGYFLFRGHPFGAIFMLILLKVAVTAVLMLEVKKRIGQMQALGLGLSLQFFWWFYGASHWGFNPFPLVSLAIILLFLLIEFLEGKQRWYYFAGIPIFLAFNSEVAGATVFFIFYFLVGVWGVTKNLLSLKRFVTAVVLVGLVGISRIAFEILIQIFKMEGFYGNASRSAGIFSSTNFKEMSLRFLEIFANGVIPQSIPISILIFSTVLIVFLRAKRIKDHLTLRFVLLTTVLFFVSLVFFGSNRGWWDWHTIYIPTLVFISLFLMLVSIPKWIGLSLLTIVLLSQFNVFKERYFHSYPGDDPSILANELKAIDWIYYRSRQDGFNVYVYTPHVFDYPYQYLFWWYGRKKYGYLPCEYANYPNSLKYTYIPGSDWYSKPTLGCNRFVFLIIEPDDPEDGSKDLLDWLQIASKDTKLVSETHVGRIRVEKRVRVLGQ